MAEIRVEALRKRFGEVTAVDDIDLVIADGGITVLVGPSGCGKTTTLRMIAGLEDVTGGRILIGERDVTSAEPKDRDLAMVFQNYALYPHMTAFQNMAFALKARDTPHDEIRDRVMHAAELLGITDLLERRPKALSGGQQQRVAIGRAIVRQPAAFLFDEPLSNLDAKLRVEMRTEILKLQKELNATILYVTHDQEEAMTLADEMVVMRAGAIAQQGPPRVVYAEPASEFVGGFVGSPPMNVIAGEASGGVFRAEGLEVPVPLTAAGPARLGVRPEHLRPSGPGEATLTADVEVIEFLGSSGIVSLRRGNGDSLKALVPADALESVLPGAACPFRIDPGHLHLFSADGSARLH
ncbi:MAG: ABC transporter ATP-binding protein [Thermoleophilia bacterium]|nr:ABC transporter ATP-binding protein [Thermoleophilia bacterium]